MEESEIIYPLDGDDVIPVNAEEVILFQKMESTTESTDELVIYETSVWMAVELENGTVFSSNGYNPSEANNLLSTLLKKMDFVLVNQIDNPFCQGDYIVRLSGVRFSSIIEIDKRRGLDYVDYGNPYASTRKVVWGKLVESTVENYRKWKDSQEDKNGRARDNLPT